MADLLPGSSDSVIAENIKALRRSGMSESDAVREANKRAHGSENHPSSESKPPESEGFDTESTNRSWVIFTKDDSGLGWAKLLIEEGEEVHVVWDPSHEDKPKDKKVHESNGSGWCERITLEEAKKTDWPEGTYLIFAENNYPELADKYRAEGRKVFGTGKLSEQMEHDRAYAVEIVEEAGLQSPETVEFSSREEGLAFLDANASKGYVYKPDDGSTNYSTFVPIRKKDEDANRETYDYLAHMKEEPGTYILQERIPLEEATEANVELWLYEGEPVLAILGLEVKRKNTYDLGEMAGCGGDFVKMLPIDCPLVKKTVGLLLPFYKEQKYTGFADVNVIFTKDKQPHFLEVCNRFGYSAHVSMFLGLAEDTFANIMADYIDGNVADLEKRFRSGFASSLTLFIDHPRVGLPLHLDDKYVEQFYPFDMMVEDDTRLLSGYSSEVGVFVEYAETMEKAAEKCLNEVIFEEAVSFPDMHYRMDLGETNYYNAPLLRYRKLKQMGLLS